MCSGNVSWNKNTRIFRKVIAQVDGRIPAGDPILYGNHGARENSSGRREIHSSCRSGPVITPP